MVAFLLFLVVAIVWVWAFNTNSLPGPDARDYAQMGRELSRGNGFSTLQIFPRHIPLLDKRGYLGKENWPNLYRYPLPTILSAFFYKITNDAITGAVLQSGIAFLFGLPLVFILAARLTNFKVGIIATLFYVADKVVFDQSYSAMTEPFAIFLLLWLFLIAFSGQLSIWKCLVMGIICGLSYLNRTQLIVLFPLVALHIWIKVPPKTRLLCLGLLFGAFLLSVGPWLIRNTIICGDPFFSSSSTRCLLVSIENPEMFLNAPVETLEVLKQHGFTIAKKTLKNLLAVIKLDFWSDNFSPKGSIFLFFLFASFLYRKHSDDRKYDYFRNSVLVLLFSNILVVSLAFHYIRFFTPLMPFIYIVGVNEIFLLFDNFRFSHSEKLKAVAFSVLLLFGISRIYYTVASFTDPPPLLSQECSQSYKIIKEIAGKDKIVATSFSINFALYADRRCLLYTSPSPRD